MRRDPFHPSIQGTLNSQSGIPEGEFGFFCDVLRIDLLVGEIYNYFIQF